MVILVVAGRLEAECLVAPFFRGAAVTVRRYTVGFGKR